jgi:hypothetical protein
MMCHVLRVDICTTGSKVMVPSCCISGPSFALLYAAESRLHSLLLRSLRAGVMHFRDVWFPRMPEQFWMDIVALVSRRLVYFHLDAVGVGPGVLADAGYLPGNLDVRLAGLDDEAAIGDFRRDDSLRKLADDGELIAEIRVEGFKPGGHCDDRCTRAVCDDVAIVNVHHIGRFHERMVEIFVSWIQGMINLKGAAGLAEIASNVYVAGESTGEVSAAGRRVYSYPRILSICINAVTTNSVGPRATASLSKYARAAVTHGSARSAVAALSKDAGAAAS